MYNFKKISEYFRFSLFKLIIETIALLSCWKIFLRRPVCFNTVIDFVNNMDAKSVNLASNVTIVKQIVVAQECDR